MTPTPSPHSSFQDHFRFGRNRRQRNTNPYDASHNVTPTQAQSQDHEPVSPHIDEGVDELSSEENGDVQDLEHDGEDGEMDEEENDGEDDEEEGGIEEGVF
jgi:hypothetical protein